MTETVYIGADHAGKETMHAVASSLEDNDHTVIKVNDPEPHDDYPDIAKAVADKVTSDDAKGVLICGTGTGMVMAANRVPGVRAAVIYDDYSARKAREDNKANVAALRGRRFDDDTATAITKTWLNTSFSGKDRHKRRIQELKDME